MTKGQQALQRLREGNQRFASEANSGETFLRRMHGAKTAVEQKPSAIILGCSDSRVPVEIVFDEDLGDLFVIRVAGNIVAPSQLGSVEFAAERFGARLVGGPRAQAVRRHSGHAGAAAQPRRAVVLAAHALHCRTHQTGARRAVGPRTRTLTATR